VSQARARRDRGSVAALLATIEGEHGRLDALVNDIFGGDPYAEWDKPGRPMM
jgi:hypothetical protein